jgi:hypothetical protein
MQILGEFAYVETNLGPFGFRHSGSASRSARCSEKIILDWAILNRGGVLLSRKLIHLSAQCLGRMEK